MLMLNAKKTVAHDDVICAVMVCKILKKMNRFGNANRINSGHFNDTTQVQRVNR